MEKHDKKQEIKPVYYYGLTTNHFTTLSNNRIVTIDDVLNSIAFEDLLIKTSMRRIVYLKYQNAIAEGKTENEAVSVAMDKLRELLKDFIH